MEQPDYATTRRPRCQQCTGPDGCQGPCGDEYFAPTDDELRAFGVVIVRGEDITFTETPTEK